jgi:hypothetical protein
MQNPINLTPITNFAQLVKSAELSQSKEIRIDIQQARILNATLVEMMDKVLQDYDQLFNLLKSQKDSEVINVSMDGGTFSNE